MVRRRLLLPSPDGWTGVENSSQLSGYPYHKRIEQAGPAYEQLKLRLSGQLDTESPEIAEEKKEEEDAIPLSEEERKFEAKRHKKRLEVTEDAYEILNLGNLRWRATDEDIKQAYRKLVLQYHPDKNEGKGLSDELFKKINKANEDLSDPRKRRIIDSEDEFDDSFPLTCSEANFYDVFGAIFERFSKWSSNPKIPKLGTPFTPYAEVQRIYNEWYAFKSWRDFTFEDEFDLSEAESREEKRWMERQNNHTRKKFKKAEAATIRKLVETAEGLDPRIKKRKQELLDQKNAVKQAKAEAVRQKAEAAEKAAQEEKARKEAEERAKLDEAERKKKEKANQANKLRKLRTKLRGLCKPPAKFNPTAEDVELICARCSIVHLVALTDVLAIEDVSLETAQAAFNAELEEVHKSDSERAERTAELLRKEAESTAAAAVQRPWSENELSQLASAIRKWPAGVPDRWQLVTDFLGSDRSVKEVIQKAKDTANLPNKPQMQMVDAFERFNNTKKVVKVEITATPSAAGENETTTEEQLKASAIAASAAAGQNPIVIATVKNGAPPGSPGSELRKKEEWTAEEQKLLEKGLQTYSTAVEDRWGMIAQMVGRSKKDCVGRYKYLVAQIKSKKGGA